MGISRNATAALKKVDAADSLLLADRDIVEQYVHSWLPERSVSVAKPVDTTTSMVCFETFEYVRGEIIILDKHCLVGLLVEN